MTAGEQFLGTAVGILGGGIICAILVWLLAAGKRAITGTSLSKPQTDDLGKFKKDQAELEKFRKEHAEAGQNDKAESE